jgi:Fe-S-cluster containining protein
MVDTPFGYFKQAVAAAWPDIGESCRTCKLPDCMGYISIQPSEQTQVLKAGVRLMRVNGPGGPSFIDNYPRDGQGRAVVGVSKPKCPYRDRDGRCTVHANKPLVCSMYPLGIEMVGEAVYWAIYLDCEYVQLVIAEGRFETMLRSLMDAVHTHLTTEEQAEITQTFRQSYALAAWPDGANRTALIEEVRL